jgi:hypothetical protein
MDTNGYLLGTKRLESHRGILERAVLCILCKDLSYVVIRKNGIVRHDKVAASPRGRLICRLGVLVK